MVGQTAQHWCHSDMTIYSINLFQQVLQTAAPVLAKAHRYV